MLKVENVTSGYGKKVVLRNITLSVEKGEIATLIGANGSGKTTLMKSIMGLIPVQEGVILFQGKRISGKSTAEIVAGGVSLVPEGRRVFPTLTVMENMQMGAYRRNINRETLMGEIEEKFDIFPRLRERSRQAGGTLSGGEQQMLAIARALMSRPDVLLLDEPSMGLAPLLVEEVFETIKIIRKKGTTILLVEQNANMALATADKGYILENGQIVLSDSSANLIDNEGIRAAYLGVA